MNKPSSVLLLNLIFSLLLNGHAALAQERPASEPVHGPQRWEEQIQKFEAADREKMPESGGVVFVGSSSIRGWKLEEAFPRVNAINRGFGGSYSSDAAHFAERIITPYKPRLVVFYSGENDITDGATPEEVLASFKRFVEKVREPQPQLPIVFISLKPSPRRWHLNEQFQQANALVREYAQSADGIDFVDIQPDMIKDGQPRAELFREDMLHMNADGYAIWNKKLRPWVERK
jgi:lysophospholipase L1-like esterase